MADRNDWNKNRDREQELDRERGGHRLDYGRNRESRVYEAAGRWENEGGRAEGESEGRGNSPRYEDRSRDYQRDYQDDRGRERGESPTDSRNADFGHRGDWGRQGSWGTYGNRPSFDRERGENQGQYGGQWSGRYENPSGGSSRGRNEGQYAGSSQYGNSGQYGGGMGSYSGGFGGGNQGQYAGRGPKNWQRSDDRIKEDVNERLTEHSEIDATEIDVQVKNGEVTISGSVDDRRIKRMVEDLVEGVSGVKEVHNQLRASQGGTQPGSSQGGETAKSAGSQTTLAQSRK